MPPSAACSCPRRADVRERGTIAQTGVGVQAGQVERRQHAPRQNTATPLTRAEGFPVSATVDFNGPESDTPQIDVDDLRPELNRKPHWIEVLRPMRVRPPAFRARYADRRLKIDRPASGLSGIATGLQPFPLLSTVPRISPVFAGTSRTERTLCTIPSSPSSSSADVSVSSTWKASADSEQNCAPRAHWRDRRAPGGHASQKRRADASEAVGWRPNRCATSAADV